MDLEQLRNEINKIDDKIMSNYIERVKLVEKVAEYKKENHIEILNSDRENAVCERLTKSFGECYKQDIFSLYPSIMNISKLRQARKINGNDISKILLQEKTDIKTVNKIGVQGVEGSFSFIAAKNMYSNKEIIFFNTFEDVFVAIKQGEVDFGILPIENSSAGSVNEIYDLLFKYKFFINKAKKEKINHCLLATKNSLITDINQVYSHPQAIYQCKNYLFNNNIEGISKLNTAIGAKEVSLINEKNIGAIASKATAKLYGLKILEENIQDAKNNYTRFIAISRNNMIRENGNKISFAVLLEHKQGSLFHLLNIISSYCVNMTKLESRPILNSDFEFLFYFDIIGNMKDKNLQKMLIDIKNYAKKIIFLGGYEEL